ncbi:MAG: hypothetical protein V3W09_04095 [Nitrososphaerales archaeon]
MGKDTTASKSLESTSEGLIETAAPSLDVGGQQLQELLTTGGIGAQIPAIMQAVEASKSASSRALRGTEEDLTRAGISGTEAQTILGEQRQTGEQAAAGIPSQFALPIQQQVLQAILGLTGTGVQGLGQAGGIQAQLQGQQLALLQAAIQGSAGAGTAGLAG